MANSSNRSVIVAIALDLLAVALFVVMGRRTHQESSAIVDISRTMGPFVIGLVLGWVIARLWQRPVHWQTGVIVWVVAMVVGMFSRRLLFGDGTALTFVIVAGAFLAVCFVGWRLVASRYWPAGPLTF